MGKSYAQQIKETREKELMTAKKRGFNSVEEFREAVAIENRKKSYLVKIRRFEKYIPELEAKLAMMKDYVATH